MKTQFRLALGALSAGLALSPFAHAKAATCESLAGLKTADGVVTSAGRMAAGAKLSLTGPLATIPIAPVAADLCRVKAKLSPVKGSDINVEVWLPATWNGKLVGVGGGGFSGGLDTAVIMLNPLVGRGYVAAATDVGHPSSDGAKWAYKHPVQLVDYAHRGNHVTALFAKALIKAFYGRPIQHAYFNGCSNGGRDALMEAWRYPNDYDGIVAGAPAAPWVRDMTDFAWNTRAVSAPGAALTVAKLKLVSDAVMARCDAIDGVKDGILENPHSCRFEPTDLKCNGADGPNCLTDAQIKALQAVYQGPRGRGGRKISNGFSVGGESVQWADWITNEKSSQRGFAEEFYRWMVYADESWTLDRFDLDRDFDTAMARMGPILNSDNPNLQPFMRGGGKLIVYHGWADAALSPDNTIDFFEALNRTTPQAAGQARLFMVPG
ncbi:MAG TPA: tannase/feruloyl esterase family alpha/beta hydrolase, partial [Caulobacteraceae bacterium]|nr:tannase/feruloyl esterase family alpha/beta hydrolase [Caulobacteraceae bacterium]